MRGHHNHALATNLQLRSVVDAYIDQHQLYHLKRGYPAILPGVGRVWGELLVFEDLGRALGPLDALESAGEEYERGRCLVHAAQRDDPAVEAWVYRYPSLDAIVRAGGQRIERGRYPDF